MTRPHNFNNIADAGSRVGRIIGGKRLVRHLNRHALADRYLGHDLRRGVDCLVYLFDGTEATAGEQTWEALRSIVGPRRAHALRVDEIGREAGGVCWVASPYPGNHEALITLETLRRNKGGVLSQMESTRAIEQLLDASIAAHDDGACHGAIAADEVVIDPRGSLFIELYGLRRRLAEPAGTEDARQDEIRSIAALAWTLLTGIDAGERDIFASQAARSIDRRWLQWIERGLDPIMGFEGAREAVAALPGNGPVGVEIPAGGARALLGRLSLAVAQRKETAGRWSRKNQGPGGV